MEREWYDRVFTVSVFLFQGENFLSEVELPRDLLYLQVPEFEETTNLSPLNPSTLNPQTQPLNRHPTCKSPNSRNIPIPHP